MTKRKSNFIHGLANGKFTSKKAKLVKMSEYLMWLLPFSGDADWDAYWLEGIASLMRTARHTKKRALNEVMRKFVTIISGMHENHPDDPVAINMVDTATLNKFGELRCNADYLNKLIDSLGIERRNLTPFNPIYYFMMTVIMRDARKEVHPEEFEETPYEGN